LNTVIPLPWQRLVPERCDCNYQNAWTVKEYCSLFIDTGHSLWRITIMPLIKVYNIDSDPYGLEGHSIFKSVCNTEASWRGTFGHPIQTALAENHFFLQDLRRRSIVPTAPKLVIHSGACGHVGLLLEVELAVAKLLLVIDERRQRERLLLVLFIQGFQARNMDSSLVLVYKNDSQVRSMEKILGRINATHAKKGI
jgi:hypothetical protein